MLKISKNCQELLAYIGNFRYNLIQPDTTGNIDVLGEFTVRRLPEVPDV